MGVLEEGIRWLQQAPPWGVLLLMFVIAYLENVIPPLPSDVLLVFAGTTIGLGTVDFATALLFAAAGSTAGFVSAYFLGKCFEGHVVSGRFSRFLPAQAIHQVEGLHRKHGYGVIAANRFLGGLRSLVAFFAGMSGMNLAKTALLCAVSATAWNAMLLYLGKLFAGNWRAVAEYLQVYSVAVTVVVGAALVVYLRFFFRRSRRSSV